MGDEKYIWVLFVVSNVLVVEDFDFEVYDVLFKLMIL